MKRAVFLRLFSYFVGVVVALCLPACSRRSPHSTVTAPEQRPLVVRPETESLLLTWIDDKGDFHVETRVADVPMTGRDSVRVVDPGRDEDASGDQITVVDLRATGADGTYPLRQISRLEFETLAVNRREKTGPTLGASSPATSSAASASAAPDVAARPPPGASVVVYGAEWCSACHDATRYLRRKGIPYVEKDIEKDPAAAREMQAKLSKHGLRSGSIPVLDVRGKVMVGFNQAEVDAALGEAL